MTTTTEVTTLRLPHEVKERLRAAARRRSHVENRDLTWCDLVRQAIDSYLAQEEGQ